MAYPNIFFFTGENDYLLRRELLHWREAFGAKHGEENLLSLTGKRETVGSLLDAIATMPFLAENRLVSCEGLPKFEKEDLLRVLEGCHPHTVLVFVEPKPDKRLAVTKLLLKEAMVKEFVLFTPKQLQAWLDEEERSRGIRCTPSARKLLLDTVGTDPWMLSTELAKLALFRDGAVDEDAVRLLSLPSGERVIWGLTNLLGERKTRDALLFFHSQIERGEDPYSLWSIVLDMVKKTALVWAAHEQGMGQADMARQLKMHPMAVRGLFPLVRSLDRNRLTSLVAFATESDKGLKTGTYKYTAESPEEVIALVERAIVACG